MLRATRASYIIKLQRVQNAAARLISNTKRFDHISPVMKDLHWLPVKYRIMFKLVVYTFKALHGSAPTYIHQLIRVKPQSNHNLRSNTKHLLLDLPNKTKIDVVRSACCTLFLGRPSQRFRVLKLGPNSPFFAGEFH